MHLVYECPNCGHEWITQLVDDTAKVDDLPHCTITCGCGWDIFITKVLGIHLGGVSPAYVKIECEDIFYEMYLDAK